MHPLHLIAIHLCSGQRPIAGAHGYPAGQRKNQEAGKDGNCPASARPVRFRRCPPRVPRLTADLFPRFARSALGSVFRRASRSREAPPQSRLGALLPLSLVGTRSCFSRDRFSQRLGASFSLRRLGAAHRFSPALGSLRKLVALGSESSCRFRRLLGPALSLVFIRSAQRSRQQAEGLRALAQSKSQLFSKCWLIEIQTTFNQRPNQNKELIKRMPLIEIPPQGKDVSITVHLPEETANDVKLYARFLKATHQSAPSAIINECIRRTLKQDTEFQTWKSDPANTKSNRGGVRPRKNVPFSHQSNKPEPGAKAL
jgi:hypothetical protein